MISNSRSSENVQDTDAANEGVRKAVATFYRDDSDRVFLGLLTIYVPNIIPANFF